MSYFILLTGICLAAFGIVKYTMLKRNEPRLIKISGLRISEEVIWLTVFLIGFILMLAIAIEKLEPHFSKRAF